MKSFYEITSQYANPKGKTFGQIYLMLRDVYIKYDEYHDDGFEKMVVKFAGDDFYNMHYVAKEYLKQKDQN